MYSDTNPRYSKALLAARYEEQLVESCGHIVRKTNRILHCWLLALLTAVHGGGGVAVLFVWMFRRIQP